MKRIVLALLGLLMVFSFCACGQSSTQTNMGTTSQKTGDKTDVEATSQEISDTPVSISTTNHAGTRSDPYNFTDEILLTTKDRYNDYIVEYTINLSELWGGDKVSAEFPNYNIDDRILVRGQIIVNCDSTDDEINFNLNATYVTSSLNEESANIQTYKKGELNNQLRTVYSGGSYDIMIFGNDDGIGALDIIYLKIQYTDTEGNNANIWVQLPEISDVSEETSENTDTQLSDSDSDFTESSEPQSELTPEELDALLLEQPLYVESTQYVVQHERYKSLYPDMLQAIVKNNSGTDVKNVVVAFVAWDENNLPVKIYGSGVDIHGAYVKQCQYSDANILNGTSYGDQGGLGIDEECGIATFKAMVVSYDDFDGNTWNNPYYETWVALYSDKRLN